MGCAPSRQIGVRADYQHRVVSRIGVAPFYSRSTFSLPRKRLDHLLEVAQQRAVTWLRERGFDVVAPTPLRRQLAAQKRWVDFERRIQGLALAEAFEGAGARDAQPREMTFVRQLRREGALESRFLLLAELLYHTATTCHVTLSSSPLHIVDGEPSSEAPRCLVTHLQARLLDTQTGETLWFNRRLRETYTDPSHPRRASRAHVRTLVDDVLGGADGLRTLRPSNGDRSRSETSSSSSHRLRAP